MKLVTIVFLILALFSSSMPAVAQGPVPFRAYEQTAGASSSVPAMPDAKSNSTAATAQAAKPTHMTTGGKVMFGVGIAFVGIGVLLIGAGASVNKNDIAGPQIASVGVGAGAGFAGVGTVLIIFGLHKHTKQ